MKFLLLVVIAGVCNANDEPDVQLVESLVDDLLYDENGKLATNYVLFPFDNEANCGPEQWESIYGFEARPVADSALQSIFVEHDASSCEAVCVERGTDRALVHAVMPHKRWQKSKSKQSFKEWFDSMCKRVEVCLLQYHSKEFPVVVYWVSPENNEWVRHLELAYGERSTRCFSSYIGHEFVAVEGRAPDAEGEEVVIESVRIEHVTTKAIGQPPPYEVPSNYDFEGVIEQTLIHEWHRHNRVKRTFSELGFKKGRLPEDIYANMGAFYYNNRQNKILEEWGGKGVFVNWWESDVYFIQIPWDLKSIWHYRLSELVEAWAGIPIEQTDMYGLRQYEEGARLLTHVDREATHAVSLIVNIDQGNLSEPWAVEVQDHADRLHEVIMEPGDIVYYESAKALHGRNRPLTGNGAYYVNLFTHYRPVGDPKWYEKTNPPGVPEPLLEIEGTCRLETVTTTNVLSATTTGTENQLGLVQSVRCDDPRLGPYVSPTFFRATQASDLMDWWVSTSPKSATGKTPLTAAEEAEEEKEGEEEEPEEETEEDGIEHEL